MIPSYSRPLAPIQLRTSQNASQLTASRLIGLATALPKAPPLPSSFFCIKASQLCSTSSPSRNPKTKPTNTPQSFAQTFSSPSQLPPSHVHQRHLRATDRRLNSPRTADFSPRLSATLHNQVLRHLQLHPQEADLPTTECQHSPNPRLELRLTVPFENIGIALFRPLQTSSRLLH
jgi:hypothetical protein